MRSLPFLWEIGCEEIPADWLPGILDQLRTVFSRHLEDAGLEGTPVEVSGTLRRLVVHVARLPEKQRDRREQVTGPPARMGRTEDGAWSQAALGFAKKKGIHPKELAVIETPKGPYVGYVRTVRGRAASKLLPSMLAATLRGLSFPKFMNWDAELADGKGRFPFGRPIRWMVCLLGRRVVPFEIRVGDGRVKTSNKSRGHRFLAPKGIRPSRPFAVDSFEQLKDELERRYVVLDPESRRSKLEKAIAKLEKKAKSRRSARLEGLSVEVLADLVEWPGAVLGGYPDVFLSLPVEVRHTVLIHHQKYVPLDGVPAFIAVTNMASDPKQYIRKGTERVVVARLRDAKFFWDEDLKKPLVERREALSRVLFHEKLGTYDLKVERIVALSRWIAERSRASVASVARAAELSKCDLTTGMVGEFPELQGVMGGLYAKEQGEPDEIWKAVYAHYRPAGLGDDDDFPLNAEGAIVSLSDKLDTLAGLFHAEVVPTGSKDPFGLRRAALGVVRILLETEDRLRLRIDLTPRELVAKAVELVGSQFDTGGDGSKTVAALDEFLIERLRFVFSREFRYDEIHAVFALGALAFPVPELARRLDAVRSLRDSEDFEALSVAFKRVRNILSGHEWGQVDPDALVEEAEHRLWSVFETIEPEASRHFAEGNYSESLRALSRLRPEVDRFFDQVLVMAEEPRLRENRLALLATLQEHFTRVADLSEIVAGPKAGPS